MLGTLAAAAAAAGVSVVVNTCSWDAGNKDWCRAPQLNTTVVKHVRYCADAKQFAPIIARPDLADLGRLVHKQRHPDDLRAVFMLAL